VNGERRRLARDLKDEAGRRGFALAGVTDASAAGHADFYRRWLAEGRHGDMAYLAGPDAVERRSDLRGTLPGVRSVLVVAHEYFQEDAPGVPEDPSRGVIARYARGRDYHKVVKKRLLGLLEWLRREARERGIAEDVEARPYVDTGPILERELARRAGLGWFGKNTMLIHPRRGSWFFLGVLLLDLDLPADAPFEHDHCGTCRRCLDACPTGALLGRDESGAPVIDARLCISYLTIEHRGPIPHELRPLMGNRVFGCDICQEVCPFNVRFAERATEPGYAARGPGQRPSGVEAVPGEMTAAGDVSAETPGIGNPPHPGTSAPSLVELMRMTREDWDAFSRGSAIRRAGYAGFKRNVAVAMGNWLASVAEPPEEAVAVLRKALEDESELVREHAAWALARVEGTGRSRVDSTARRSIRTVSHERSRSVSRVARQLAPETVDEIVRRVVSAADPDRVILFGSAARGELGPNSDIDLLVVKSGEYRRREVSRRIREALRGMQEAFDLVIATPHEIERYGDCFALVYHPALRDGKELYAG
jgi:epoxyqueuosine reductase